MATIIYHTNDQQSAALPSYQKKALMAIDVSSGPAMVTPLKLLQRELAWIDCMFCYHMAKTRVTLREEKDEPSGYVSTSQHMTIHKLMGVDS